MNYLRLVSSLLVGALMLAACAETGNKSGSSGNISGSSGNISGSLTKYSYEGAPLTVFTGTKPPWNEESRLTGYFIHEELAPNTTYDFLDPDIDWPFVNLPSEFSFSDGARTITHTQLEAPVKNTGDRQDPSIYECRTFNVKTDENGDIMAWDILFVHDVRASTFLTAHNGGIYGQDLTEVDTSTWGCVASVKCTGNANYTSQGPIFDSWMDDLQHAGKWTKEIIEQ